MNQKKILVCGAGSIGLRHLSNIKKLNHIPYSWRIRKHLLGELNREKNIKEFNNLNDAIKNSDAVVVATAPNEHDEIIKKCIDFKKPMLIEKPISNSITNLSKYLKLINELNLTVEIGCMLRFHPNIIFLKENIHKNMFGKIQCFLSYVGQNIVQWRPDANLEQSFSRKIKSL